MNLSPTYLIKLLLKNGFLYKRASGSHHIYYNPATHVTVTVPIHGSKDLKKERFYLF